MNRTKLKSKAIAQKGKYKKGEKTESLRMGGSNSKKAADKEIISKI